MKDAAVLLVSVLLAALRIAGVSHEAFQAVAHLWVGILIGYWYAGMEPPCGFLRSRHPFSISLVIALSLVEVVCFLVGLHHSS